MKRGHQCKLKRNHLWSKVLYNSMQLHQSWGLWRMLASNGAITERFRRAEWGLVTCNLSLNWQDWGLEKRFHSLSLPMRKKKEHWRKRTFDTRPGASSAGGPWDGWFQSFLLRNAFHCLSGFCSFILLLIYITQFNHYYSPFRLFILRG